MSSKSQAQQIFIYILAIILIGVIFIYGYKSINYFINKEKQISQLKFQRDIQSVVDIMSTDYGSVKRESFPLGGNYQQVCFVSSEAIGDITKITASPINEIIKTSVEAGVQKNTFLLTTTVKESFDAGPSCIGREGLGV